jgi:hypothetical protein
MTGICTFCCLTTFLALLPGSANDEIIKASPPDDFQQRMKTFQQRNSPEVLEELAHQLAAIVNLENPDIKSNFTPLYQQEKYAEALEAYKDYLLQKLKEPEKFGIPSFCVGYRNPDPEEAPMDQILLQYSAEDLMQNIVTVREQRIDVGEPGAINWVFVPPGWEKDTEPEPGELLWRDNHTTEAMWIPPGDPAWAMNPSFFARSFRQPCAFNVLLSEYVKTGERKYLDKWSAYIDDWSMNQQSDADNSPHNIHAYFPQQVERFYIFLDGLAYSIKERPEFQQDMPASTLVRLLLRRLPEVTAATSRIQRVYESNWRYFIVEHLVRAGILFNEFRFSEKLIREGIRGAEDILVVMDLPDGTDYEADPCYFGTLAEWMTYPLYKLARSCPVEQMTDKWVQKMQYVTLLRARNLLAFLMPNGRWPIYAIQDERQQISEYDNPRFRDFVPDFFDVPDNARRLNRAFNKTFGNGETDPPSYESEALPYCGFYFLRSGWEREDHFGFMNCIAHILGNGSGLDNWMNNNAVSIYGFGAELLFNHHETPVTVDGFDQNVHWGLPIGGHIGYMPPKPIHPKPAPRRWHDSENFAFAEGLYDGRYGKPGQHIKAWLLDEEPDPGITDVKHLRQIMLVKPLGLWIITDYLDSESEHEYSQEWMLHLPEDGNYGPIYGFSAQQVDIDQDNGTIKTASPGGPNVSVYQICSAPLKFDTVMAPPNAKKVESWTTEGRDRKYIESGNYLWAYTIHRINTVWKGSGHQVLVTVVYPRSDIYMELKDIKPLKGKDGIYGFDAEAPDGAKISYRTAADRNSIMELGDISIAGESLVTFKTASKVYGIALGTKALRVGGNNHDTETGSAEFILDDGKCHIKPIYKPIEPVRILPDISVFTHEIEITMSSETPDLEIRYTLDGSDPTPESQIYNGSVKLKESAEVRARAFRPGIAEIPSTLTGTQVSAVTKAVFTKQAYRPALQQQEGLIQGLRYDYYEAHWRDLLLLPESIEPIRTGSVKSLMNTPEVTDKGSYGFRYSGFFQAPSDGVYTFCTVEPLYDSEEINVEKEFDLNLWIDGELWYPATTHHAFGTWSVALEKGMHKIEVFYADFRGGKEDFYFPFRSYRAAWRGKPELLISDPGLEKMPIPASLLWHKQ